MSPTNQSNSQYNRVMEIINKIVTSESEAEGKYIYRGEHQCYEKASSGLYRAYADLEIKSPQVIPDVIRKAHEEISESIDHYLGEIQYGITSTDLDESIEDIGSMKRRVLKTKEDEILARIQHYGGKTNLIDFTTDYLIALFFACLGSNDEDGRVILLKNKDESGNYKIKKAPSIIRRAETQKSIFVEPDKGFIDLTTDNSSIICIPGCMKGELKSYLRDYHDISAERVYNDLHGFIRLQDTYLPIYEVLSEGQKWEDEGDKIGSLESLEELKERYSERQEEQNLNRVMEEIKKLKESYQKAIGAYSRALKSTTLEKRKLFEIHHKIGIVYYKKGEYDQAIEKYGEAIELNPEEPIFYYHRGEAYEKKGDDCQTVKDFEHATEDYQEVIRQILMNPENKDYIDYRKLCGAFLKCEKFNELRKVLQELAGILEEERIKVLSSDIEKDANELGGGFTITPLT